MSSAERFRLIPSGNELVLSIMGKNSEEFSSLDDKDRFLVILTGDHLSILSELFATLKANVDCNGALKPWGVMLHGMLTGRNERGKFWSVIVSHAPKAVTIRRRDWGVSRLCRYVNYEGGFDLYSHKCVDGKVTGETGPTLNALDFQADDWEVVDNPNITVSDMTPPEVAKFTGEIELDSPVPPLPLMRIGSDPKHPIQDALGIGPADDVITGSLHDEHDPLLNDNGRTRAEAAREASSDRSDNVDRRIVDLGRTD